MSDRTDESRPHSSSRRTLGVVTSAALLAGWWLWTGGLATGQQAKPRGADDAGSNRKVAPQPADPPAAPPAPAATDDEPAGQGIVVATGPAASIRQDFAQLADSDADVREAARLRLMSLDKAYLPTLRRLVERSRPLRPSQAAVLRQIVTHVFLSGEEYASNSNLGFLGVKMADIDVTQEVPLEAAPVPAEQQAAGPGEGGADEPGAGDAAPVEPGAVDPGAGEPGPVEVGPGGFGPVEIGPVEILPDSVPSRKTAPMGVVIIERMPGFVGYRTLLDGDIVIGLADHPDAPFLGGLLEFSTVVKRTGAGGTIRFTVLRRGRLSTVEVTLDPRPDTADDNSMVEMLQERRQKADALWKSSFAPLLNERVG